MAVFVVDASNPNVIIPIFKEIQVLQETDKKIKMMKFIAIAHKKILLLFFNELNYFNISI